MGMGFRSLYPQPIEVQGTDHRPALPLLRDAPPFSSGEVVQQASSFEVLPGLFSLTFKFAFNTTNFMCYFYLFLPFETRRPVLTLMA